MSKTKGDSIRDWIDAHGGALPENARETIQNICAALDDGERGKKVAEMLAKQVAAEKIVKELKVLEAKSLGALRDVFSLAGLPILF